MPEPVERNHRYIPGLDGLRAVAVGGVIAYHLGASWAPGGLLGVAVFFTLSGYLITDLLLAGYVRFGRLRLETFWLARARRLLPPFLVMLAAVLGWVAAYHRDQLTQLWRTAGAAVGYFTNWWLISQQESYFNRFGPPNPLAHLWSLAVEEQFYLVWPFILALGLWLLRSRRYRPSGRVLLATGTLLLAAASAVEMAVLYDPTVDATRIYDGTDTRAFGLLIGAALAMLWPTRQAADRSLGRMGTAALDVLGTAGLAVIGLMMWRSHDYKPFLYHGGLVLLSFATAAVIAAIAHPQSRLGKVLGCYPLRWLGVRSYAIYLWHYPVIILLAAHPDQPVSLTGAVAMTALTIALSALSWTLVENPIRRWAANRAQHPGPVARRQVVSRRAAAAIGVLAAAVFAVASVGLEAPSAEAQAAQSAQSVAQQNAPDPTATPTPQATPAPNTTPAAGMAAGAPGTAASSASPSRTSCRSVVHIGDSTSVGLSSPAYLPDPRQRIDAQYADVGAKSVRLEISGARSTFETLNGIPNAETVADEVKATGYDGCWVLALGTNDTANVAVGSVRDRASRIAHMMDAIGDQPVMWVSVKSLLPGGYYSAANMQAWDDALRQACDSYPNMRVYDWAAEVQTSWFSSDGVHFTSEGYAHRAQMIAAGLTHAFPAGKDPASSCFVR